MQLTKMTRETRDEFFDSRERRIFTGESLASSCPDCGTSLFFTGACCYCRACGWSSCKEA